MAIISSVVFLDTSNGFSREVLPAPGAGFVNVLYGLRLSFSKGGTYGSIAHPDLVDPGVAPDIIVLDIGKTSSTDDAWTMPRTDAMNPLIAVPENQALLLESSKSGKASGTVWFEVVTVLHAERDGLI